MAMYPDGAEGQLETGDVRENGAEMTQAQVKSRKACRKSCLARERIP